MGHAGAKMLDFCVAMTAFSGKERENSTRNLSFIFSSFFVCEQGGVIKSEGEARMKKTLVLTSGREGPNHATQFFSCSP